MRSLRDMGNPYQHAPDVSIVRPFNEKVLADQPNEPRAFLAMGGPISPPPLATHSLASLVPSNRATPQKPSRAAQNTQELLVYILAQHRQHCGMSGEPEKPTLPPPRGAESMRARKK